MTATTTKSLTQKVTSAPPLPVFNVEGEQTGHVEIDPAEFGGKINQQLLHDAVLMYEANVRRGTHSTKRRGEVAGSTRKLFRQKGTGNARVGNRRTNKRRGGGTAKGPKPRDYVYHMPKKAIRSATRMALLSRFHDEEAFVIENLHLEEISTAQMGAFLDQLEIGGAALLIGLGKADIDERQTIYKSARNIPLVQVLPVSQFNTYAILRPVVLMLTKSALEELCQNLTWVDFDEEERKAPGDEEFEAGDEEIEED